jgi:chromate transporter
MVVALLVPSAWGQIAGILLGGAVGILFLRGAVSADQSVLPLPIGRTTGAVALSIFLVLLVGLPLLGAAGHPDVQLFDKFFRVGSLVFGGGHVVLPLLKAEVVPGLVSNDAFLAGYGAAQAVPGPLFTFAAYLGAVIGGWKIALLCLIGIFLPSFLLVVGVLPFWDALRKRPAAQAALAGVNAAVVGLLLGALNDPVWTSGILTRADFALAAAAFLLLFMWKTPPWLVVVICAAVDQGLAALVPS